MGVFMQINDHDLLRRFARERCEDAFRELVKRHLGAVFAVALRVTGDPHRAEEVAQSAFAELAAKAGTFPPDSVVAGWLYNTSRHLALRACRSEHRRRGREQLAVATPVNEPSPHALSEHLETAMERLKPDERDVLVLRFFEERNLREVGLELGLSEDAARMRVNRALTRLRDVLERPGITGSTAWLAATLPAGASVSVPVGLGASIASSVFGGAPLATAALAVTQTTNSMSTLFNLKTTVALFAAAAVTGTSTYFVKHREVGELQARHQVLEHTFARLSADHEQALAAVGLRDNQIGRLRRDVADIHRLRGEVDRLNRELAERAHLRQINEQLRAEVEKLRDQSAAGDSDLARENRIREFEERRASGINELKALGLALRIYAGDHDDGFPSGLHTPGLESVLSEVGKSFPLGNYEQVYFGKDSGIENGVARPNIVLVRQREPLVNPDGERVKIYTVTDGSVHEVAESAIGSFEEFERDWTNHEEPIVLPLELYRRSPEWSGREQFGF